MVMHPMLKGGKGSIVIKWVEMAKIPVTIVLELQ